MASPQEMGANGLSLKEIADYQEPEKDSSVDSKNAAKEVVDESRVEVAPDDEFRYSKLSTGLMILFSALAIGSDGFNSSIIGNLELIFAILYPEGLTTSMTSRLSNAFTIGMIIGMILFGYIADKLGRKSGAVMTTLLLVLGIILSTAADGTSQNGLFWMMLIGRGIAGVGAGGEYPVAGPGAAEATDESKQTRKHRGFIFAIISETSSDLGFIFGGLVPLLLLLCVHNQVKHYELVWRLSYALGAIPPISIFYFRYKMAVSTAYRKSAMKKQRVPYWLAFKRYWRPLLGVSASWFLYNYISYPFGIFASTILSRVNIGSSLVKNMGWGTLINCFYIPGGLIGGLLSDRIGRRKTMALGFFLQAIFGFILGGALGPIQTVLPLFIVMYGIFLTLGEVGPGATVVLVSSESFPTSIRGHCMGLASAWSKAGASIGNSVFKPILSHYGDDELKGNQAVFLIGSAFALVGALVAFFIIPDVDNRLESEDDKWKKYLLEQGYEIEWGDHSTADPKSVTLDTVRT